MTDVTPHYVLQQGSQADSPLIRGAAYRPNEWAAARSPGEEKVSILVVDDEPEAGEILARWLFREGCECTTAARGSAAVDLLQSRTFQLVISDVMMPGMTGSRARLRHLRRPFGCVVGPSRDRLRRTTTNGNRHGG